jgi:hypothetical protein
LIGRQYRVRGSPGTGDGAIDAVAEALAHGFRPSVLPVI